MIAAARRIIKALDVHSFNDAAQFSMTSTVITTRLIVASIYIFRQDGIVVTPVQVLLQTGIEAIHARRIRLIEVFAIREALRRVSIAIILVRTGVDLIRSSVFERQDGVSVLIHFGRGRQIEATGSFFVKFRVTDRARQGHGYVFKDGVSALSPGRNTILKARGGGR